MERGALPVSRFTLTSSKEPEAYAVAMQPVYVAIPDDSLDTIREYGNLFTGIAEKGLIALNYDYPLPGYPYDEYWKSEAFRHFTDTSKEAKQRGFTFDTPHLELGSITLSEKGHSVLDRMLQ
jgi:hypothetical protein